MGVWVWIIPNILRVPAELAVRMRVFPIYLLPVLLAFFLGSYYWLKPVMMDWRLLVGTKIPEKRLTSLLSRAYRYPYHAFLFAFVGIMVTGVVVGLMQMWSYQTSASLVIELVLLAVALGCVFSMFAFFLGRLKIGSLHLTPSLCPPGSSMELGPQRRIVLGMVCMVLVNWIFLSVMLFDNHINHTAEQVMLPFFQPQVVGNAVFFAWIGPLVVLLSGILSSYMARDLTVDINSVAGGLKDLAEREPRQSGYLPVLSPDELGDLTAAFNCLAAKIEKLDNDLAQHAKMAGRAGERQKEFFNVISHDLRTPLHSIVGFSQLLLEDLDEHLHAEKVEDVTIILSSAYHLLSLVDDLVDFSRMDSGLVMLSPNRVELERIIEEAMQAAGGLPRGKNVELLCELQPGLPQVYVDETRMRQILFNLIGNALKYTKEGTVLVRAAEGSTGWLRVMIEDTGPGIPDVEIGRIFEEFEQVSAAHSESDRGSGLGLAITKRLVEMHGGEIRVGNRAGGGTVFSLNLPVADSVQK